MSGTAISRGPVNTGQNSALRIVVVALVVGLASAVAGAMSVAKNLLPPAILGLVMPTSAESAAKAKDDHHADHQDESPAENNWLEVSAQARKNIGLKIGEVTLREFERTIPIPGVVEERPGRSTIEVVAPMAGIVTRLLVSRGHAVEPNRLLFELRMTHEELVQAQSALLRTVEELDVISQEVKRLEAVGVNAIAGKSLLERKYEQQKAEAVLRAQKQALILHHLSEKQVDEILKTRKLLDAFEGFAPSPEELTDRDTPMPLLQVQNLHVNRGQNVAEGQRVLTLADHSRLLIAGIAFEKDIADIQRALEKNWLASASIATEGSKPEVIPNLEIVNLDNQIDTASRTIHVYISLPNTVQRDAKDSDGNRFLQWRFKPGQRMQIHVPVERWSDRIVLPIEAVVQDGVDWFVFTPNGDRVERRPVHLEYRDHSHAVIANDGSLFPGEPICLTAAQQLQLALKNKAGGGVDPHAGHTH